MRSALKEDDRLVLPRYRQRPDQLFSVAKRIATNESGMIGLIVLFGV